MENSSETPKTNGRFVLLADLLIAVAIVCVGHLTFQSVQTGTFPWWPYPAFVILTTLIFVTYRFISRVEEKS